MTHVDAHENAEPRFLLTNLANEQDEWLRRIVRLVLASGRPCSEADIQGVYELYRQEKQLDDRTLPAEPALELEAGSDEQESDLVLASLSDVEGVNAIVEGGTGIDFNPGLTILFGENGTGKTGYARILKALANSRSADEILGNVHSGGAPKDPSAQIKFLVGGDEDQFEWRGERGHAPFTRMSVFDSPAVNTHVDADLDYVYTPASLTLFNSVNQGIQGVEELLKRDVAALKGNPTSIVNRFDRSATVFPTIETLGAATDLEELKKLAVVPDEVDEQLNELRLTVAALKSNTVDQQLTVIKRHQRSIDEVSKAGAAFRKLNLDEYNAAVAELKTLQTDSLALKDALFQAADLPSEPDDHWEGFVRQGRAYKQHLESQHVDDDGKCIYCRQELEATAIDLLGKYEEYLGGKIAGEIESKLKSVQEMTGPVIQLRVDDTKASLAERQANPADDDEALQKVVDVHESIVEKLEKQEPLEASALSGLDAALTSLAAAQEAVMKQRGEVENQLKNSAESLRAKESELRELESKIELKKSWPEIELHVKNAKTATRIDALLSKLPVLRRQVTEASKLASERLVNQNFAKLFEEECGALRAPELKLEFTGRQGSAQRRKVIADNHKPSKILSEGEQKVLALADFLSEARLNGITAPIVFDDPVSSLDHRRINEVADRVAALAEKHQVVVFTHDILFATNLLARFEKEPSRCVYFQITDTNAKGEVTKATGPRWDTLKSLKANINQTIEAAENQSGDAQAALVRAGYGLLRSWCEVFVEAELLQGVTQRYQPNVRMGSLDKIKSSALPDAIAGTNKIFDEACRYIDGHSQPLPTLGVSPTLDGLKDAWKAAQECRSTYLAAE